MRTRRSARLAGLLALAAAACGGESHETELVPTVPSEVAGTPYVVADTTIAETFEAPGVAQPFQEAVLSTRLMGTVREVLVHEGARVRAGQVLVRLDAAELEAKGSQVAAQIQGAEAMLREAERQAARIRALYADSAATRAQLDAAETGLSGAAAALDGARAGEAELAAVRAYATITAPFAGMVTARMVDPGALAAPGAPLVTIQDAARLRIPVQVPMGAAAGAHPGQLLPVTIHATEMAGTVEGVVPAVGGNLATINVVITNADFAILPGSAATVAIPTGERSVLLVPQSAVVHQGDLTGVYLRTVDGDHLRWIRLGRERGTMVEVAGGLAPGARLVVPRTPDGTR